MNGLEALKMANGDGRKVKDPQGNYVYIYLDSTFMVGELLKEGWEAEPEKRDLWVVEHNDNYSHKPQKHYCYSEDDLEEAKKLHERTLRKVTHYQKVSESGPCKPMSVVGDREGWLK